MTPHHKQRIKIKDRNLIAYLIANGYTLDLIPRTDAPGVDGEIEWSEDLDRSCADYHGNRGVPVQSFIQACRFISNHIALQRQR
jgi:hypothetical protein